MATWEMEKKIMLRHYGENGDEGRTLGNVVDIC